MDDPKLAPGRWIFRFSRSRKELARCSLFKPLLSAACSSSSINISEPQETKDEDKQPYHRRRRMKTNSHTIGGEVMFRGFSRVVGAAEEYTPTHKQTMNLIVFYDEVAG
ncbi:hypothetical protein OIU74_005079 [Salix koriyanagi]|uniref:Uncharacterized protein n=1 Tax=Salix koriyanagi TaxID=2511006 RepID=A0A9Q0ZG81_9ROSI|nr:hypothetical protein OIU74_005079 [Salix koriyanagi]